MQRREFLKGIPTAVVALTALSALDVKLFAGEATVAEIIAKETAGKGATSAALLIAPAIAENGLVVPLKVEGDVAIEKVKSVSLYAIGNPTPKIISASMSPDLGKLYFSTRTKLAKSQDVLALVELTDGTFLKDVKNVKVTIGGCG